MSPDNYSMPASIGKAEQLHAQGGMLVFVPGKAFWTPHQGDEIGIVLSAAEGTSPVTDEVNFMLHIDGESEIIIEAISKRPLELNIRVGSRRPILEILNVCLRLAASPRLDLEPD